VFDLHQGFTGRELTLSPYIKLGLQQVNVLVRLFKGQVMEAGGLQIATVTELGRQVTADLAETARRVLHVAEERVLGALKTPSSRSAPASGPVPVAEPAEEPRPAFTPETAQVVARPGTLGLPFEVAAHAIQERLKGGEDMLFLDVREPVETLGGVIPGARLIPLDQVGRRAGELASDGRPIVVYCASGNRSRAAAQQLLSHGLSGVSSLRGGIRSWAQNGGDITLPGRSTGEQQSS
jgi:rhodanese-related sulfurtransferase